MGTKKRLGHIAFAVFIVLLYPLAGAFWMSRADRRPIPSPPSLLALRGLEPIVVIIITTLAAYLVDLRKALRGVLVRLAIKPGHVVAGAMLIYVGTFTYFTFQRHWYFNSAGFDLGIQDQVVWNTAHGRPFQNSLEVNNYLGDHFQPLLALLAPLYRIWPSPYVLLAFQTLVLAGGAIPVYRLAALRLRSPWAGALLAMCYLLYPSLGFVNRFDFHWEATAIPLLLGAIYSADMESWGRMSLLLFLSLLAKEEIGLTVAAFGLWLWWRKRARVGGFWAAGGVLYSVLTLFVIIPSIRQAPSDTLARYGWLGDSPWQMLQTVFSQPRFILAHIAEAEALFFAIALLGPFAFMSLFSSQALVMLPAIAYNLLSSFPAQQSVYFQYVVPLVPFVVGAGIFGVENVVGRVPSQHRRRGKETILIAILTFSLWFFAYLHNPLIDNGLSSPAWQRLPNNAAVREGLTWVDPEDRVFTTNHYVPHLSQRRSVYTFIFAEDIANLEKADVLFFNLRDFRHGAAPVNCETYLRFLSHAEKLGYGLTYNVDHVLVLKARQLGRETAAGLTDWECLQE